MWLKSSLRLRGDDSGCLCERPSLFESPDQRQDSAAKILDLFLEVQERGQNKIHSDGFEMHDSLGNLLRRADQVRLEPVVVLHQILKRRFRPISFALRRGRTGVFDLVTERFHRLGISFINDFRQHCSSFVFGVASDDESIHSDLDAVPVGGRLGADVVDLPWCPTGVLPLVKYQSDTRAAMSRAARELPPWKISGCGCCSGFGFRV